MRPLSVYQSIIRKIDPDNELVNLKLFIIIINSFYMQVRKQYQLCCGKRIAAWQTDQQTKGYLHIR